MEVEINWKGKKEKVIIEAITFGDLLDAMKQSTKSKIINGMVVEERDETKMSLLILLKSIKKAPFEVKEENIRGLSLEDGAKLMEASAKVNSFQGDTFGKKKVD